MLKNFAKNLLLLNFILLIGFSNAIVYSNKGSFVHKIHQKTEVTGHLFGANTLFKSSLPEVEDEDAEIDNFDSEDENSFKKKFEFSKFLSVLRLKQTSENISLFVKTQFSFLNKLNYLSYSRKYIVFQVFRI